MAQTVEIPIRIMDAPQMEAFIAAYRGMARALKNISQLPEPITTFGVRMMLDEAHITVPGAECWCEPRVEHVPAGG